MRWGVYEAAIRRWEHLLGRPAPLPTQPGKAGRPRLSAAFVEWMMGLPSGWVTGTNIPRTAQLRELGNGVVPQQAAAALVHLANLITDPNPNPNADSDSDTGSAGDADTGPAPEARVA
jgi:hypothetical protein